MSINVFEMAFRENANLANIDSDKLNAQRVASKALSESVIKSETKLMKESIKLNKIRFTEDIDDIDIQPSEDVVVVYSDKITPEMSAEEVEKAAEELIGSTICKCGICGANYIADDNHKHADDAEGEDSIEDSILFTDEEDIEPVDTEDEEFKESLIFTEEAVSDEVEIESEETDTEEESENIESDTVCPVCHAEDTQVEVGVIAPNEESEESTEDDDNSTDSEETEETEDEDDNKTEETDDNSEVDDDENIEEGLFGKKKKKKDNPNPPSVKKDQWEVYDCWNKYSISTHDTKPEAEEAAASKGDDGRYRVQKVEEGIFGKKKKNNKSSNNSNDTGDVERKVSIKIYDENGTLQFSHTFKEIPGKMSAEDQLKELVKGTALQRDYKNSRNKYDWSYERKSEPESNFDTKRGQVSKLYIESVDVKTDSISFKDRAFNILLNKFVRENYKNIKSIRIDEGRCEAGELVFEGVVNTFKGSTHPITFKTVKFAYTEGVLKLRMTESGVFTESAEIKEGRVPFVLECAARNGYIVPRVLKCKYNVRESGKLFECFGRYTLSK